MADIQLYHDISKTDRAIAKKFPLNTKDSNFRADK